MERGALRSLGLSLAACIVVGGCSALKYEVLRGTSLPNPPPAPVAVTIKGFPVTSKASVLNRRAGTGGAAADAGTGSINSMAEESAGIMEISRPCRLEDLSGAVLRELRQEKVRVFADLDKIDNLDLVRQVANPYRLVAAESQDAQLEISGKALIHSQRVSKAFSQKTTGVELELSLKDLATGRTIGREKIRTGIRMTFNSRELEEAMAIAVVTYLTQKTLF